jgi:hypothetical protein
MVSRTSSVIFCASIFLATVPNLAFCAPSQWPYDLRPSYQSSPRLCSKLFEKASTLSPCRLDDAICPGKTSNGTESGPFHTNEYIAMGAYGYGEVHALIKRQPQADPDQPPHYEDLYPSESDEIASALPSGISIVYLLLPGGRNFDGVHETWKVDHAALANVLGIPLPPLDPNADPFGRGRNASQFSELLKASERLSTEISPLITHNGRAYVVERECSGRWGWGYYYCNRIIKITIKRVEAHRRSPAVCQLSTQARRHAPR